MFICFFLDTGLKKLWSLLAAMGQPQMVTVIPQTTSFRVLGDQTEHEGGLASPGEEVSVFAFRVRDLLCPCPHLLRSCKEVRESSLT